MLYETMFPSMLMAVYCMGYFLHGGIFIFSSFLFIRLQIYFSNSVSQIHNSVSQFVECLF